MKAYTVSAPLGTLLTTRQPCDCVTVPINQWHYDQCKAQQMVAQWITSDVPCPPELLGQRVMFHQDGAGLRLRREPDDGNRIAVPLGCVVGSGVIAEHHAILSDDEMVTEVLPDAIYVCTTGEHAEPIWQDSRWNDAERTAELRSQLPYNDWSPGRLAWRIEQAAPTTERCPWCWGLGYNALLTDGVHNLPCRMCGRVGHLDPFRVKGRPGERQPALHEPHCNTKCDSTGHWLHDDTGHAHERDVDDECAACRAGWWDFDPSMIEGES